MEIPKEGDKEDGGIEGNPRGADLEALRGGVDEEKKSREHLHRR